jgi:hypothetical protein
MQVARECRSLFIHPYTRASARPLHSDSNGRASTQKDPFSRASLEEGGESRGGEEAPSSVASHDQVESRKMKGVSIHALAIVLAFSNHIHVFPLMPNVRGEGSRAQY